jgi:hypothetical protein
VVIVGDADAVAADVEALGIGDLDIVRDPDVLAPGAG